MEESYSSKGGGFLACSSVFLFDGFDISCVEGGKKGCSCMSM